MDTSPKQANSEIYPRRSCNCSSSTNIASLAYPFLFAGFTFYSEDLPKEPKSESVRNVGSYSFFICYKIYLGNDRGCSVEFMAHRQISVQFGWNPSLFFRSAADHCLTALATWVSSKHVALLLALLALPVRFADAQWQYISIWWTHSCNKNSLKKSVIEKLQ